MPIETGASSEEKLLICCMRCSRTRRNRSFPARSPAGSAGRSPSPGPGPGSRQRACVHPAGRSAPFAFDRGWTYSPAPCQSAAAPALRPEAGGSTWTRFSGSWAQQTLGDRKPKPERGDSLDRHPRAQFDPPFCAPIVSAIAPILVSSSFLQPGLYSCTILYRLPCRFIPPAKSTENRLPSLRVQDGSTPPQILGSYMLDAPFITWLPRFGCYLTWDAWARKGKSRLFQSGTIWQI